jgi:hypothetical protein
MSSPDLAPSGPQGPPKKGSGPRPTMSQMFTAPKVQIQETKTVPLIDLQKLEADVTLLEAKKKAEQKKKAAAVVIPKSVPSVELKISEVAPVASLASTSASSEMKPASAPATEVKPASDSVKTFLPNLFGTGVVTESEVRDGGVEEVKSEDAVKVVSQQAKLDAFLDDEGPAQENALMQPEKPVDDKAFLNLKAAVETKVGASPVRVTPREKIFMPATRRSIHQFVIETYSSYILKKPNPDLVGDACKELSRVSAATVENFKYQEFVRDYMQKGSPFNSHAPQQCRVLAPRCDSVSHHGSVASKPLVVH